MKKWQYKIIDSNTLKKPGLMKDFPPSDVEDYLNKLGEQGWELINFECKFKVKEIETFFGVAKMEGSGQAQSSAPNEEEIS